jgi:hypothetical protein
VLIAIPATDAQALAGDSAAGALPAAARPKAAINATSNAVRMSDVSPILVPCGTAPDHLAGQGDFSS